MKITIERLEGKFDECFEASVRDFKNADMILRMMAKTAPTEGYDKTKFVVAFDADNVYQGRLDLQRHHEEEICILESHILSHCKFMLKHESFSQYHTEAKHFIQILETAVA